MRPEALEAMLPYLTEHFGNPSGGHGVARRARLAVDEARDLVAHVLGCRPGEVVFTGGGTEADNLAVTGTLARSGGRAVCSAIEHHAVLHPVEHAGGLVIGVDGGGIVDLDELAALLRAHPEVTLVSVMLANNEVGVIQPLADVVETVRRRAPSAVVHTDAVQAAAWLDLADPDIGATAAHLLSIAAHKVGGPKGVGALIVRLPADPAPLLLGGGQERERRSGTHDVAGIVGMAAALAAAAEQRSRSGVRLAALRDRLVDGLLAAVPGAVESGDRKTKVAGNAHLRFPGVEGEALLALLDDAGVFASAGSACAAGALDPSHVLAAMGVAREEARAAVRCSLGWTSTPADIDRALAVIPPAVERLRSLRRTPSSTRGAT